MVRLSRGKVLAAAGNELLECYKEIAEAWVKAEQLLSLSHVPKEVRVLVHDFGHNEESPEESIYLGYVRLGGQWRICEVTVEIDCQNESYERAIEDCPLDVRLEMLDHFDKLYAEVLKTTKDYVPKVKDRVSKFLASLEALNG